MEQAYSEAAGSAAGVNRPCGRSELGERSGSEREPAAPLMNKPHYIRMEIFLFAQMLRVENLVGY